MSNFIKFKVGQVIKNYKELCSLLGVEPTKGKGRKYHIQEFERYCKYIKEGHKFIITEVYAEPLPKIDGRVNNGGNISNTKYEDLMDRLIINLLIDHIGINASYSEIVGFHLDFFTEEYENMAKAGYTRYANMKNMSKGLILTYQQKLNNIIRKCLETSLRRLDRNGIIHYEKKVLIRDDRLNKSFADEKIKKIIAKTEKIVYEEMKIKYYNRIVPEVNQKFKGKVCNKIGLMSYWNVYSIELIDEGMERVEEDTDELKRRLIKSVDDAVKRKKSEDEFGNVFYPYSSYKYEEDLDKLKRLLWKMPEGYITEYQFERLLIGTIEDINDKYKEYEDNNEFNKAVPF